MLGMIVNAGIGCNKSSRLALAMAYKLAVKRTQEGDGNIWASWAYAFLSTLQRANASIAVGVCSKRLHEHLSLWALQVAVQPPAYRDLHWVLCYVGFGLRSNQSYEAYGWKRWHCVLGLSNHRIGIRHHGWYASHSRRNSSTARS